MNWVNAIVQGILLGGLYALFACGLSLLFGVVRVGNLAHGDFAVLAAYLALVVITTTHVTALLTFVIVAPLFAVFGYGVQRLIIQRSLEVSSLTTLLVTFGLSVVIQNLLLVTASADSHSFDLGSLISASFRLTTELSIGYLPLLIFVTSVVVLTVLQLFRACTGHALSPWGPVGAERGSGRRRPAGSAALCRLCGRDRSAGQRLHPAGASQHVESARRLLRTDLGGAAGLCRNRCLHRAGAGPAWHQPLPGHPVRRRRRG